MLHIHVPRMVTQSSSRDSRSSTGEDRVMRCRILLEGDSQNRVCGIVMIQQGPDESKKRLQRAEVDRDSEFDTTGCYAQRIQQIEQYHLYIYIFPISLFCLKNS
jgi:hypothetical protein